MRLDEIFDNRALSLDSALAIKEGNRCWSYAELLARSEEFSDGLISLGIKKGHRVALMVPNSGAFVMSFFGILRLGAVVAPFNPHFQEQELRFYLEDTSASALVVSEETVSRTKEVLKKINNPPALIEVFSDGTFSIHLQGEVRAAVSVDDSDLPILHQYTSGSTGTPKRVIRTHKKLIRELESLSGIFKLSESDKFLGAAPFSHVNGLVRTMLTSMFIGGTLFPVKDFNRREVLNLITQEKISYFGAVPYMYIILAATPLRGNINLTSLRTAFSSSAPLLSKDNRAFADKYGVFVRQLYGSTETGTISVNTDPDVERSLESVGLPLDGIHIEIIDEEGHVLPVGRQGEVAISSPTAITSYENNPEANASSFQKGYYLSGDLGFKDENGYLTLTGRKKFLINRGGYEVNPFEVEMAVLAYPKVKEVAVLGAPTSHGDQAIRCVIVTEGPCKEEEIVEHCRPRIADYKIPSIIEFVRELPKSATGKTLRAKLD